MVNPVSFNPAYSAFVSAYAVQAVNRRQVERVGVDREDVKVQPVSKSEYPSIERYIGQRLDIRG